MPLGTTFQVTGTAAIQYSRTRPAAEAVAAEPRTAEPSTNISIAIKIRLSMCLPPKLEAAIRERNRGDGR
jgi:hypothetical protein